MRTGSIERVQDQLLQDSCDAFQLGRQIGLRWAQTARLVELQRLAGVLADRDGIADYFFPAGQRFPTEALQPGEWRVFMRLWADLRGGVELDATTYRRASQWWLRQLGEAHAHLDGALLHGFAVGAVAALRSAGVIAGGGVGPIIASTGRVSYPPGAGLAGMAEMN